MPKTIKSVAVDTYEQKTSPVIMQALNVKITSPEDMAGATTLLSQLNKFNDAITEEKEKVTKPLNLALKAERERWKPLESELERGITAIRTAMSTYQTKALKEQRDAEAKIAEKMASGKLTLEKAVDKLATIAKAEQKVATSEGSISFKTVYSVKIKDLSKIPREYLVPDEKAILDDLRGGKAVLGCELEETQVPINRRA